MQIRNLTLPSVARLPSLSRLSSIAACVLVAAACEFRERIEEAAPDALPPTRAVPPSEDRLDLGPVFAPAEEGPLIVGDEFWSGPGTVGYELVGTFLSREAMRSVLDPAQPLRMPADGTWTLSEILVAVDFRGPGTTATWRVVGPRNVVDSYVAGLEQGVSGRSPISALGVLPLEVRHCCVDPQPALGP